MVKEQNLDDEIFDNLDLGKINSENIRKNKIYNNTYFNKTSEIKTALQGLLGNIDSSKDYSGKDIKDIIRQLYDKIY
jgi:hypothetical protein